MLKDISLDNLQSQIEDLQLSNAVGNVDEYIKEFAKRFQTLTTYQLHVAIETIKLYLPSLTPGDLIILQNIILLNLINSIDLLERANSTTPRLKG
jgi:hypothetical protein